ncbi:MAG: molybdopterin-binding protein [Gammaproteobacteria bacterium]|nr:molybdopterin-binding protein [Gammaproteobacteria bacterium]
MKIFKLLIIGDEILSGKRKDCHLENAISLLSPRGFQLSQSLVIGDEPALIISSLRMMGDENSVVFCFGGIGATPDDYTRQCAADAFLQPITRHPEATRLIEAQFSEAAYPKRILMADLPEHAAIVPNPINQVPGFSVGDCHFFPGFPQMAKPMMEWVLENYYDLMRPVEPSIERSVLIYNQPESELIDLMNSILSTFPDVKIASLPKVEERHSKIDLAVKGKEKAVERAFTFLLDYLDREAIDYDVL